MIVLDSHIWSGGSWDERLSAANRSYQRRRGRCDWRQRNFVLEVAKLVERGRLELPCPLEECSTKRSTIRAFGYFR